MEAKIDIVLEGLHFRYVTDNPEEVKAIMATAMNLHAVKEPGKTPTYPPLRHTRKPGKRRHVTTPKEHCCGKIHTRLIDGRIVKDILKRGKIQTRKTIRKIVKRYYPNKSKCGIEVTTGDIRKYLIESGLAKATGAGKQKLLLDVDALEKASTLPYVVY